MQTPLPHSSQNKHGAQTYSPRLTPTKSETTSSETKEGTEPGTTDVTLGKAGHWGMDVGVDVVNAVVGRDVSSRQSDRFRGENF